MPPSTADESPDASGLSDRPSAIALSYAKKDRAPIVVAKGYGAVADSIVQCARESGLYVHASPDLVKLLMQVNPYLCWHRVIGVAATFAVADQALAQHF